MNLKIPQVKLLNLDFGFEESRFAITTTSLTFEQPKVELYRDKLVADDMSFKPLYGKLLRELPIIISVDKLDIENGHLVYEEKIDQAQEAGRLFFEDLNAELNGISNRKDAKNIEVIANAKLMGEAKLKLDWSFDVNDKADRFVASGALLNLQASQLNPFLEPNLQARAKGSIQEMYFTINGNSTFSQGEMKMRYQDFKFNILKKDRLKINKVLTSIGSLFVNDGSKDDAAGYRYGKFEVERETNTSFYNYLWMNVRDGMINTLTGKGEKED